MESLSRITITYTGRLADEHILDGQELGVSLQGVSRAYLLVGHAILSGRASEKPKVPLVRCYVGPSRTSSHAQDLFILAQAGLASGALQLPADGIKQAFEILLGRLWEAMMGVFTGKEEVTMKALEILNKHMERDHELKALLANNMLKQSTDHNATLLAVVNTLADVVRPSARDMVAPVGHSCTQATHIIAAPNLKLTFDEETAAALRRVIESIGDAQSYVARVSAVDKTTGKCKFHIEGVTNDIPATITDAALQMPGNLYTRALDTDAFLDITARPIFDRAGDVKEFQILNAKPRE